MSTARILKILELCDGWEVSGEITQVVSLTTRSGDSFVVATVCGLPLTVAPDLYGPTAPLWRKGATVKVHAFERRPKAHDDGMRLDVLSVSQIN